MACPICEKEADEKYRPFCSKRCADIDLGKWLSDGYTIPGGASDEEDGVSSDLIPDEPILH